MGRVDTDRTLLEKIRRDEPGAFEEFVDRYGDRIYGFGMRFCGEREDARDVAQDTLLQAFRSLKDLKHAKALRSWLYRVAANACLMKRRKGKFAPARELALEELMPPGSEGPPIQIPDPSVPADEALARSQARRAVQEAVRSLPPQYRIVLVLRDMEQLSTRETAEALGLAETAVKMRLHRGRLQVRKHLESALRESRGPESG